MAVRGLVFNMLVALCLICCPIAYAQETISLTNGEWPPYQSAQFKYGGLLSRICSEAFAEVGVDVDYTYMPWKRALTVAEFAPYSGSFAWRRRADVEERFYYSDPLMVEEIVFFHRKGKTFEWVTLKDVGKLRVGASLGYLYNLPLAEAVDEAGGEMDIAPTELLCFQKLLRNRVDVVPSSLNVGYYLLQTHFLRGQADTVSHHPRPYLNDTLHLLISKKVKNGEALIQRFNSGLKTLKQDGRYDQYLSESLRGDYQP